MKKFKTAFITFFPVVPDNMGSSAVINSRFDSWPYQKKIFQLSHKKKLNNKNLKTIFIRKENPIFKIFYLPCLIMQIVKYLKNSNKKIVVIEGASWIFYSFIILVSFKIFFSQIKIIYISHSIESEIRKKFSNIFIYFLTKYLEKLVFKYSDFSTSVSKFEKNKIKKLYSKNTILYPNAINVNNRFKKIKIKKKYIIYSGSYLYKPNKQAIDYLNYIIMPQIVKKFPDLKFILTGGGFKKKFPWLINKNIVPKQELYNLIYSSICMCVPLKFGSGTRVKIIEALSLGSIVVSSKKGIEGIELLNKKPPYVFNNTKNFLEILTNVIKNNKKIKNKAYKDRNYYLKKYSMKKNTSIFLKKINL